jgi:hypothetical protein
VDEYLESKHNPSEDLNDCIRKAVGALRKFSETPVEVSGLEVARAYVRDKKFLPVDEKELAKILKPAQ